MRLRSHGPFTFWHRWARVRMFVAFKRQFLRDHVRYIGVAMPMPLVTVKVFP